MEPSWQIITGAILLRDAGLIPEKYKIPVLSRLIRSTIRKNDNWLNYSPPRGWSEPYNFRSTLAEDIIYLKTGNTTLQVNDPELLRDNPNEWLKKYVPEEVSSSPERPVEGQQSTKAAESR